MSIADAVAAFAAAVRDKLNTMTPRLLPSGGAAGQVLAKASGTNYAAEWVAPSAGGGETIILDGNGPVGTPANLILDGNG